MIWSLTTSSDGRFAISGGSDEKAKIWHLGTGDKISITVDKASEPKPWLTSDHPGAVVFKKCARCHAFKSSFIQRSGPHLENIFGRKVGSVAGYNYSNTLIKSKISDDASTVRIFDSIHTVLSNWLA